MTTKLTSPILTRAGETPNRTGRRRVLAALALCATLAGSAWSAPAAHAAGSGQTFTVKLGASPTSVAAVELIDVSSAENVRTSVFKVPLGAGASSTVLDPGTKLADYTFTVAKDGRSIRIVTRFCNDFLVHVYPSGKAGWGPAQSVLSPGCGTPDTWPAGAVFDGSILVNLDGYGGWFEAAAEVARVEDAAGPDATVAWRSFKTVGDRWFAELTASDHPEAVTLIADQVDWYWGSYTLASRRIVATCRSETSGEHMKGFVEAE